ncbi:hypothetical protein T492DRAFT_345113 [Pavlovales sp. CCMP2436]|nr:hypothetical protein T492DRAFT_345113 [Pavlovales sp. CCMP2436]
MKAAARAERHRTLTEHAASQFAKLALGFIVNQALLVLLVSFVLNEAPFQAAWFRPGGLATQVFWICISNAAGPELARAVGLPRQAKRLLVACFARSQNTLDAAWRPRELQLGEMYATLCRTVALGLFYGPLQPLVYAITAVSFAVTFVVNKYQVTIKIMKISSSQSRYNMSISIHIYKRGKYAITAFSPFKSVCTFTVNKYPVKKVKNSGISSTRSSTKKIKNE